MAQPAQAAPLAKPGVFISNPWFWKIGTLSILVLWLYAGILINLARQWWTDANFSHGFLVPAFAAYVLWGSRRRLANLSPSNSPWGPAVIIIGLLVLIVGVLGAELFLSRISLLILLAGLVLQFRGSKFFRAALFPWACLFLMVPIPAILFNHVTFPLQILTSKIAANGLPLMGVPVLREGNIIVLPALPLEVAEACSGIRSLLSLVTLATIYGYFAERRRWVRVVLVLSAVPVAVAANCLRVVGTGILAQYWGPAAAEGFFHGFSGWLIFMVSVAALAILQSCLRVRHRESKVVRYAS